MVMNIPLNIDWQQILLHLFNFTILFGVLYFLLYSPVKNFMQNRQRYFEDLDEQSKSDLKDAENLKAEYEKKLQTAEGEIAEMKKSALREAEEAAKLTVEESKQEAEKLIKDAKVGIEKEREKILSKAKSEISDIVASAVEKVVANPDTTIAYDTFLDAAKRGDLNE